MRARRWRPRIAALCGDVQAWARPVWLRSKPTPRRKKTHLALTSYPQDHNRSAPLRNRPPGVALALRRGGGYVYTLSQLRDSDLELPIGFAVIVGGYLINLTYVLLKVL